MTPLGPTICCGCLQDKGQCNISVTIPAKSEVKPQHTAAAALDEPNR
jgi:hypothetical protein